MSASSRIREHLRSNLIGYLALFVALTIAPAWAATIKNGSVTTKKLRNGAVTTKKVKNAAITAPKLAANSVDGSKVIANSLTGADVNEATLTGVPGGPPSGTAGGELTGTYPNPEIGVVDGLQIADSTCGTSGGIQLGTGGAQICNPLANPPFNTGIVLNSPSVRIQDDALLGNATDDETEVAGLLEMLNANTAAGEMRFCNGTGGGCGGAAAYANLERTADNVLHTDDSFDADGSLTVDGNTTLGNTNSDAVNVNANVLLDGSSIRLGSTTGDDTEVAGTLEMLNANTSAGEMRFCNGSGPACGGPAEYATLSRSASNVLHTDDSFDANGGLTVDGNTTLGDADTDVLNVDAAPVNLRQATAASDALTFGSGILANLYQSSISPITLKTDDQFEADAMVMPTTTGADPTIATDRGGFFIGCLSGTPTLFFEWPDGETDAVSSPVGTQVQDSAPESAGNTCP